MFDGFFVDGMKYWLRFCFDDICGDGVDRVCRVDVVELEIIEYYFDGVLEEFVRGECVVIEFLEQFMCCLCFDLFEYQGYVLA